MATEQRQVRINERGELQVEGGEYYVYCPLLIGSNNRRLYCSAHCAWFTVEGDSDVAMCQKSPIGKVVSQSAGGAVPEVR